MSEVLAGQMAALREKRISTSDISDLLWKLGYNLAVPNNLARPLVDSYVVGPALTMNYLPQRHTPEKSENKLNHAVAFKEANPGDVVIISGDHIGEYSLVGGNVAKKAKDAGIIACLVDGGIRDTAEIKEYKLPIWARAVTPRTGRLTLELYQVNTPILYCGIQVVPGDIVVADNDGVCFIPAEVLGEVVKELC